MSLLRRKYINYKNLSNKLIYKDRLIILSLLNRVESVESDGAIQGQSDPHRGLIKPNSGWQSIFSISSHTVPDALLAATLYPQSLDFFSFFLLHEIEARRTNALQISRSAAVKSFKGCRLSVTSSCLILS